MAFTAPTAAEFKASYPTFAAVTDPVVQAALDYAETQVGAEWSDADGPLGISYLAAHNLTLDGHGTMAKTAGHRAAGIQSMKSGSLSAEFTRDSADASWYRLTSWGVRYLNLLQRYAGGPLAVVLTGRCGSHLSHDQRPYITTRRW